MKLIPALVFQILEILEIKVETKTNYCLSLWSRVFNLMSFGTNVTWYLICHPTKNKRNRWRKNSIFSLWLSGHIGNTSF